MGGGEDSAVFAQGDVVVKLVPPFARPDAERETAALPRATLPLPSPRLLDVRSLDGWTDGRAAWHVLHPLSSLPRDLARAGLDAAPSNEEALDRLWASRGRRGPAGPERITGA